MSISFNKVHPYALETASTDRNANAAKIHQAPSPYASACRTCQLLMSMHFPHNSHTFTAYFLCGKCMECFRCFSVTMPASCFDNLLRMARVCFGRRSSGMYFLFL